MTTRWDVERAVLADGDMPPLGRLLMLILATSADQQTAVIPAKFTPSLTGLVRASGLARSTICIYLNRLETAGWLVRQRPTPQEARTKHARTRYALKVPKLVRQPAEASPPVRAPEPTREDDVIDAIVETLREVAPKETAAHTREWAAKVAGTIPGGSKDRRKYVATVIRNNPAPFLPTPSPAPFRAPKRT